MHRYRKANNRSASVLQTVAAVACVWSFSAASQEITATGSSVLLSPRSIVDFALSNNVQVQSGQYSVQTEDLNRNGAIAAFLPTIKSRSSYMHLDARPTMELDMGGFITSLPVGVQDMWDIGFSVSQPLFTGGRLINAYALAGQTREISGLRQERTKQETRTRALMLFWSYVGKRQAVAAQEGSIQWLEQLCADQVALAENGITTEDDMLKTKTMLGFTRLSLAMTKDSLQALEESILLFCNLPSTTVLTIDSLALGEMDKSVAVPDPVNIAPVDSRKDLRALYLQMRSLSTLKKIQMGGYSPNLFGLYSYDWKNSDPYNPHDLAGSWNAGVVLDWTIWDWMKNWRDVQKTDVQIAQLKLALDAQVEVVRAEARSAARAIATSVEAERLSLESLDNAQRSLEHAELRYREGLITSQELLGARKDLTQAQQVLIGSRIGKVLAMEAYKAATGQ